MTTRAGAKKNRCNVVIEGDLGFWGRALYSGFFLLRCCLTAKGGGQQREASERQKSHM
jgi:hypothetical protein